jgi:hypothetical protein
MPTRHEVNKERNANLRAEPFPAGSASRLESTHPPVERRCSCVALYRVLEISGSRLIKINSRAAENKFHLLQLQRYPATAASPVGLVALALPSLRD